MPHHHLQRALIFALILGGPLLLEGGTCRLTTAIYAFRSAGVHVTTSSVPEAQGGARVRLLQPPFSLQFDQDALTVEASTFSWSDGERPSERISQIKTPELSLLPGKPVVLLSSTPVQYLERLADGTLKLQEIPADSPDAPHWRIRFTLGALDGASGYIDLTCEMEVVTVSGRENLPGVQLEVGRPVLTRFEQTVPVQLRAERWSGLVLNGLNGGDYGLLVLMKGSSIHAGSADVGAVSGDGLLAPEEVDRFATFYYRDPRPELIGRAIRSLGATGFLDDRAEIFVGFLAQVFSVNPDRVTEWRALAGQQGEPVQEVVRNALQLSRRNGKLPRAIPSVQQNDRSWGAFFASGDPEYLRRVIEELPYIHQSARDGFWVGATAMWSLARNAGEHPAVRNALEVARTKANRGNRDLIDEILSSDVSIVREKIASLAGVSADVIRPVAGNAGYTGLRDTGYFGPVNPQQELGLRE